MSFNNALSGLQATSSELDVVSNNIANVSTTGFKKSRAEFADIYANSQFGSGSSIGSGVVLAGVAQQFSQGQIEFTDNSLDLAINGQGFFVLSKNGSISYTRGGDFGIDKNGYLVDNLGKELQGYLASASGNISGAQGSLQLKTSNLPPHATAKANIDINLEASATPPANPFVPGFTPLKQPDPSTYNTTTSATIYDSLGNTHIMTSYYVKAHQPNAWRVYVGIDGVDATPTAAAPPVGTPPLPYPPGQIPAPYTVVFDSSGKYVPFNPASPPEYYGAGPITSLSTPLANAGTLSILNLNDLVINGITVMPSDVDADSLSTTDNAGSAIAFVSSINASSPLHGVTASTNPNVFDLGIPSFGNLNPGDFTLNGVPIMGASANAGQLLGLINGVSSNTGIVATQPGGVGTAIILTANDGRNIQAQTDGTNATGASFANFDLNGGAVLNKVQRSTFELSAANNQAIVIGGTDPNNAELSSGPQAGVVQLTSDNINISTWNPGGGASGPQPLSIDLSSSTQYGAPFSVFQLSQDGYATGQLSGISIAGTGVILAKYTNGQSLALGQIALANFGNVQGLAPIGNTDWGDTFASGSAVIGAPGTANFGAIQSGALEGSNVELTEELVSLIIAQRNYQANAQTIRTEDAVTQAIINLR